MNGIIEIAIVAAVLAVVALQKPSRQWLSQLEQHHKLFAAIVLVALFLGQVANSSRTFFPLVRWSMYTEAYVAKPIVVAKIQAELSDGSTCWINPTHQFPSISRNLDQTLSHVFQLKQSGKLPDDATAILDDFLASMGRQYQASQKQSDLQVAKIRGVLQEIRVVDGVCITRDTVIAKVNNANSKLVPSKMVVQ